MRISDTYVNQGHGLYSRTGSEQSYRGMDHGGCTVPRASQLGNRNKFYSQSLLDYYEATNQAKLNRTGVLEQQKLVEALSGKNLYPKTPMSTHPAYKPYPLSVCGNAATSQPGGPARNSGCLSQPHPSKNP